MFHLFLLFSSIGKSMAPIFFPITQLLYMSWSLYCPSLDLIYQISLLLHVGWWNWWCVLYFRFETCRLDSISPQVLGVCLWAYVYTCSSVSPLREDKHFSFHLETWIGSAPPKEGVNFSNPFNYCPAALTSSISKNIWIYSQFSFPWVSWISVMFLVISMASIKQILRLTFFCVVHVWYSSRKGFGNLMTWSIIF